MQRLLAGGVALGALQPPPLGPTTVAVHDGCDVARHARQIDAVGSHGIRRYRRGFDRTRSPPVGSGDSPGVEPDTIG